ncbi:unnamed protein product, partial [Larinioides sclopetarius]
MRTDRHDKKQREISPNVDFQTMVARFFFAGRIFWMSGRSRRIKGQWG